MHAQDQRFDGVALQPGRQRGLAVAGARRGVALFLVAHACHLVVEGEHAPAGVVVAVAVDRDVDGERGDVLVTHECACGTGRTPRVVAVRLRDELQANGRFVARRLVTVVGRVPRLCAAEIVEDRRAHFAYCDCMRDARCRRRQDQDDGDTSEALMKR